MKDTQLAATKGAQEEAMTDTQLAASRGGDRGGSKGIAHLAVTRGAPVAAAGAPGDSR